MSDLNACLSRQPRPSAPIQSTPAYREEDLSQYLAKPAKSVPAPEVPVKASEAVEVSEPVTVEITKTQTIVEITPYGNKSSMEVAWRNFVWNSKALSKEYKLLLFNVWIEEA